MMAQRRSNFIVFPGLVLFLLFFPLFARMFSVPVFSGHSPMISVILFQSSASMKLALFALLVS
ncbi:hypothetical protein JHK82_022891 [Glycine max]|uniref:Uncharacterized protein n=2 Tax=Glycine subgen. Soja TaxID=1462606 RepID=K7L9L4_SOYBN|nr:hypothetical protein JHK87_022811 [Glycine soja]KAG5017267.1 hypothetical protein JHK85_023403 [Glycine max]KAG5027021.1 hypothetical protein JHK86_022935 [Glycine max]KAG5138160.1 hypothetical protein JHK82_022891 [Glycine max]KAH1053647.1 hypothetical protein GYH30_022757 [Glycine max]